VRALTTGKPEFAGDQETGHIGAASAGLAPADGPAIGSPLKLLMVEDSVDDARLVARSLERGGYALDLSLVASEKQLRSDLSENEYDLVVTDHELRGFDSSDVLTAVAELAPELPCVLISGKVGEETVGRAMHQGAVDYVAKDNLGRVPMVVERALAEKNRQREREAAGEALKRSGLLFEAVFTHALDAMLILDDDRRVVDANPAAEDLFAAAPGGLLRRPFEDLVPENWRAGMSRVWEKFLHTEEQRGEVDLLRADGSLVATEYTAVPGFLPGRHIVVLRDIRAQRAAEQEVKRRIAQGEAIAELGEIAIQEQNLDRLMKCAATSVAATLDVKVASILELRAGDGYFVVRAEDGVETVRTGAHVPYDPEVRSLESYTMLHDDAVLVTDYENESRFDRTPTLEALGVRSALSVNIPGKDVPYGMMGAGATSPHAFNADDANFLTAVAHLLSDAVERGRSEAEIRERALHDPLTGLPNRTLFFDRLTLGLARAKRSKSQVAVLLVDIDGFKSFNDGLGHRAADRLLTSVGARIVTIMREVDTVARFGGDEFVVLCENLADESEAEVLAGRLVSAFQEPFTFEGEQHKLSVSAGLATSDGNTDGEALVRDADIAMYRSKDDGGGRTTVATEKMRADVLERSETKRALERAIENDELRLDYQPIVALDGGRLCAVEALVRWEHPDHEVIGPARFIPLAEESGLILRLGEWVLRAACIQAASWRAEFGDAAPLPVHVNIAARQVAQPKLPELVARILEETGVPAQDIALELTETALIDNLGAPMTTLAALRSMGVSVVLDDFGTGYSSLSYLDRFPIDTLKIDRAFVSSLGDTAASDAIVNAIVGMARALGIDTVAEGVETAEQTAAVAALGCRYAQGYFFARPTSADQIAKLIHDDAPLGETTGTPPERLPVISC
jgi:diguanylate cyclase (GGDEF)-like protein/PAS domain S-box-containing protein